jgi:hypothetical protein
MPAAGAASGRARRGRGGDKNEGTGEKMWRGRRRFTTRRWVPVDACHAKNPEVANPRASA